jgi:tetratricopeptide (TPR) repeat protein
MKKISISVFGSFIFCLLVMMFSGCSPEAKKADYLEKASNYFDSKEYSKAEIEYLNVLQIDPEDPQAVSRLGIIYFDQGRVGRAFPYLTNGRRLDPENPGVRLRIGATHLVMGKLEEARGAANFVLEREPGNEEAPLLLANASVSPEDIEKSSRQLNDLISEEGDKAAYHVGLGLLDLKEENPEEAERSFERARALDPKSAGVLVALGNLYWARNDLKLAEEAFRDAAENASTYSANRLRYVQFKMQTGDLSAGKKMLEEVIAVTPDYLSALAILAEIEASEKNFEESAALITKILVIEPGHPDALLMRGRLSLAQGNAEKAVEEFEAMLRFYPNASQAYHQMTRAHLAQGQVDKAIGSLDKAIALVPDSPELLMLKARLNAGKGDFSASVVILKEVTKRWPEAQEGYQLLAEVYQAQGSVEEALKIYHLLVEKNPEDPRGPFTIGLILIRQERADEARLAFEKALKLDSEFVPALEQLINLDLSEKRYDRVWDSLESLLKKNPDAPRWHLLQGRVLLAQEKPDLAETAFRKVIGLQPENREAYMHLAQLFLKMEKEEAALEELRGIVKKDPSDVAAYMLIGMINGQQKKYDKARSAYEKILTIDPQFVSALNNLAYLYSEQFDQLEDAYEMAQKARNLLPEDPSLADTFGWILFKRGEYARALNILEDSADKLPDQGEVQFHLAMTHYMMGQEELARKRFQKALLPGNEFNGKGACEKHLKILNIDPENATEIIFEALKERVTNEGADPIALGRLGYFYEIKGDIDEAKEFYGRALDVSPKYARILAKLAGLLTASGDVEPGYNMAKKAYDLKPEDPDVSYTFGRAVYLSGDYKWALSLFQETSLKRPEDPNAHFDLAMSAYALGRISEAKRAMGNTLQSKQVFSRAEEATRFLEMVALFEDSDRALVDQSKVELILSKEPDYAPALMALAGIYLHKKDVGAARKIYESVLERLPDFALAKRQLATLYSMNPAEDEKAYAMASEAYEAYPQDGELAKTLGILVYRQGDNRRAIRLFEESLRKDEDDPVLMHYLGMAHYHLKDWVKTREFLERALELGLSDEFVNETRQTLEALK